MEIRTLGIDLGETSFHIAGFDAHGRVVTRPQGMQQHNVVTVETARDATT